MTTQSGLVDAILVGVGPSKPAATSLTRSPRELIPDHALVSGQGSNRLDKKKGVIAFLLSFWIIAKHALEGLSGMSGMVGLVEPDSGSLTP